MKATNHLGSLFFLLLLATLSFDGSAVDRLFFYFKNKIKKPAERECCCVNLNQKRGAILPVIMYVYFHDDITQAQTPLFLSYASFPYVPNGLPFARGFSPLFEWKHSTSNQAVSTYTIVSYFTVFPCFFQTKTRINIWNEFKFTCLYCRHCCCCQLGDLDREKGLNKIWERERVWGTCVR